MKDKKYYNEFLKLYEEAYKLGVIDLFHKVFHLAYNQGYNTAVDIFVEKGLTNYKK